MLVCQCTHCGRPAPLSLASTAIKCVACGFQGQAPPAVAQSLQAAALLLRGLDVRQRQLTSNQRRALSATGVKSLLLVIPGFLVTFPMVLVAGVGGILYLGKRNPDWTMFAFSLLPLAVVVLVQALAFRAVARKRRALLEACAATPPEITGGAVCCHLCGGPLEPSTQAVVRCSWCSSDNVVDGRLLRQLGQRKVQNIERVEDAVRDGAACVAAASRGAGLAVVGAGCLAPLLTLVLLAVALVITSRIEIDPNDEERYAVVRTPAGDCVARVNRVGKTWRVSYGGSPEQGYIPYEDRPNTDGLTLQSAEVLTGRRVIIHQQRKKGRVEKVYAHPMQGNYVRFRGEDGSTLETSPQGLCLLDGQP